MSAFFKVAIIDDEQESARALVEQLKVYPRNQYDKTCSAGLAFSGC